MSHDAVNLRRRFAVFHGDIQAYYEVFGSIPVTASMERLTALSEAPVGVETNSEMFAEPLPLFADEVLRPPME